MCRDPDKGGLGDKRLTGKDGVSPVVLDKADACSMTH